MLDLVKRSKSASPSSATHVAMFEALAQKMLPEELRRLLSPEELKALHGKDWKSLQIQENVLRETYDPQL